MGLHTMTLLLFAADEAVGGAADAAANPAGNQPNLTQYLLQFWPFALVFVAFYFFFIRPQRAEQSKRLQALAAIKKNDRVVTIGGLYGVVFNVRREIDEVTIKVDEDSNTKLRFRISAIDRVLSQEAEKSDDKPNQ